MTAYRCWYTTRTRREMAGSRPAKNTDREIGKGRFRTHSSAQLQLISRCLNLEKIQLILPVIAQFVYGITNRRKCNLVKINKS